MLQLVIRKGRAKPLWHGHPWVYAQAVERLDGDPQVGDPVRIVDHDGQFIGTAFSNPQSAIAARIASRDPDEGIDGAWLRSRLERAIALRRRLDLPSQETDCYRLINAEGDGLPGLIVDVYGEAIAVQFTAAGVHRMAALLYAELTALLGAKSIVLVEPGAYAEREGIAVEPGVIAGAGSGTGASVVPVRELGILYEVDLLGGQKTGLFLDQRENHALVRTLARGARVADIYSYEGGFALNAARGGAKEVIAIDSSARAVAAIARNAAANTLSLEAREEDAFRFLAAQEPARFDLVILDPPKFARSRRDLDAALKGYRKLFRHGLRVLAPGGILCAACCSQLVSREDLERALALAAIELGRPARLLGFRGAGPDHPVLPAFPEGDYLRFFYCEVGSGGGVL